MKKSASHLLMSLLVAIATTAGISAVTPGAAYADTGYGYCFRDGCNGKDPLNQNCNVNAYTVASATANGSTLELRYSPDCDANWARVLTTKAEPFFVRNANGNVASYTSVAGVNSWSNMVNGQVHAWSCLEIPPTTGGLTAVWVSDSRATGLYVYPDCPYYG